MKILLHGRGRGPVTTILVAFSCFALSGFGGEEKKKPGDEPVPLTVPKAICGPGDHPETGLQGQVSAAVRAAGFKGFNCNLELVAQSQGDGANWQTAEYRDGHSRVCAYHGSASPSRSLPGRNPATLGVPVIDVSEPSSPIRMGYLQTTSMLDPWESLKVNERRKLLAADNGQNGGGGPEVDIYDVSEDCRFPQLLATVAVGKADGTTGVPGTVVGHEGSWAPDGLTYYGGDLRTNGGQYYAVDTGDPTSPTLIARWTPGFANVHGLSISDDGNRGYFVSLKSSNPTFLNDPNQPAANGLLIYDLSEIQARKPNPQPKLISTLFWKDGATAQHTINVKIDGKPYIIFVDEAGSGGNSSAGWQAACAASMPAWPMARIIDISDETKPTIVSRLALEIHNPANCAQVLPDLVGLGSFTYGSHYCSVDNRHHATTLACGYFNSGIRVFDIRDPIRPKEIAYYNPAGTPAPSPGSNHTAQWRLGGPDWCSAQVHLDRARGTLWTTCQDNGLLMLKFTNGAWPYPESATPPGEQN
jgi:hypothetical protein